MFAPLVEGTVVYIACVSSTYAFPNKMSWLGLAPASAVGLKTPQDFSQTLFRSVAPEAQFGKFCRVE